MKIICNQGLSKETEVILIVCPEYDYITSRPFYHVQGTKTCLMCGNSFSFEDEYSNNKSYLNGICDDCFSIIENSKGGEEIIVKIIKFLEKEEEKFKNKVPSVRCYHNNIVKKIEVIVPVLLLQSINKMLLIKGKETIKKYKLSIKRKKKPKKKTRRS